MIPPTTKAQKKIIVSPLSLLSKQRERYTGWSLFVERIRGNVKSRSLQGVLVELFVSLIIDICAQTLRRRNKLYHFHPLERVARLHKPLIRSHYNSLLRFGHLFHVTIQWKLTCRFCLSLQL